MAVVGAVLIYAPLALTLSMPSGRNLLLFDILQLPGGDESTIAQITTRVSETAESKTWKRETIRLVVQNRSQKPDLVTHVSLRWGAFDRSNTCYSNSHYVYRLADEVKLSTSGPGSLPFLSHATEGVWTQERITEPSKATEADTGMDATVTGRIDSETCYGWLVSLSLDVTVPVEGESFAIMDFDFPARVKFSQLSKDGETSSAGTTNLRFFSGYNKIEATASFANGKTETRVGKTFDNIDH